MMYGNPDEITIRVGFFKIDEDGNLILYLRFREIAENEMELDPAIEIWNISVDYPFIELSRENIKLITTLPISEEWDNKAFDIFEESEFDIEWENNGWLDESEHDDNED